jgi:hypothetical protein
MNCGAPTKIVYGTCDRPGKERFHGRCWQHAPVTDEERAEKKRERLFKLRRAELLESEHVAARRYHRAKDALLSTIFLMTETDVKKQFASPLAKLVRELRLLLATWKAATATADAYDKERH